MPSEVEEIEAILREHLDCEGGAVGGIYQAAAAIAALRSKDREDGAREERIRFAKICADKLAQADRALASRGEVPFLDDSYRAAVAMAQDVVRDIIRQIEPVPPRASAEVIALPLTTRTEDGNA